MWKQQTSNLIYTEALVHSLFLFASFKFKFNPSFSEDRLQCWTLYYTDKERNKPLATAHCIKHLYFLFLFNLQIHFRIRYIWLNVLLFKAIKLDTKLGQFLNHLLSSLCLSVLLSPSLSLSVPPSPPFSISPYQWGGRHPRPAQSTASRFILCNKSATAGEPGNACKLCVCNLVTSQA